MNCIFKCILLYFLSCSYRYYRGSYVCHLQSETVYIFFFSFFLISICNTRGGKKFRGTFATKMLFLTLKVLLLLLGFKKEILSRTPVA